MKMKLYEDFDFITDGNEDIKYGDFILKREDIEAVLKGIEDGIKWAKKSAYRDCFKNVYVVVTDSPVELTEFVDIDDVTNSLYIHMNVAGSILYYHHEPFFRKIIFKENWEEISLYTYSQFFFLHELGHIVHAHLENPDAKNSIETLEAFDKKYKHYVDILESKYERVTDDVDDLIVSEPLQRAYRKLPQEKMADKFAFMFLEDMKRMLK